MIRACFSSISYADGTTYTPPVIQTSTNGWVYKPDELRTKKEIQSGTNRAWPRKTGEDKAIEYITADVKRHFHERGYETPIQVTLYNPAWGPAAQFGTSLTVAFKDGVFGWTTLGIKIVQKGRGYSSDSVVYSIHLNPILLWLFHQEIREGIVNYRTSTVEISERLNVSAPLDTVVREWVADPWGVTTERLRLDIHTPSGFTPPSREEFVNVEYPDAKYMESEWDGGVWSRSKDNGNFYIKGVIEKIMVDQTNWEAVTKLTDALRFVGYDFQFQRTGFWGDEEKEITGFKITIPEQDGMHRHRVKVDATNPRIEIECGFMEDEERWIAYKQRKAVEEMRQLEEALQTFEIDLGERGVE